LTGHTKGFQAEVRQVAHHTNFIHRIIHRDALESRDLQPQLHTVLQEAAKVINFVKPRSSEISPICSAVRGNAGRPQITSIAFGEKIVMKR
jgi:hypothetical protein